MASPSTHGSGCMSTWHVDIQPLPWVDGDAMLIYPKRVARPKVSGRRSSSTILNQVCLSLPILCRQSLEDPECRPEELESGLDWCRRIVYDRSGWSVWDWTTSLETKSVQWIWRIRLRHQLSNASICPLPPKNCGWLNAWFVFLLSSDACSSAFWVEIHGSLLLLFYGRDTDCW